MKHLKQIILGGIATLAMPAASAYDFASGGLYYNVLAGTGTVEVVSESTGISSYSGRVIIPSEVTYEGAKYTVAAIGKNAFNRSAVTDVQIPNSVTAIGDSAFYFSEKLENLTLPLNLAKVNRSSLAGTAVKAMWVPEGVKVLGNGAFQSCLDLHTAFLPSTMKTIEAYGFNNCESLMEIYSRAATPPGATGWAIFIGLSGIDVVVPDVAVDTYGATAPWNDANTFTIYPSEPVEVTLNVKGENDGNYDVLTLGENIAYKIYRGTELEAITTADKYYIPADGATYTIVPTNGFSDADAITYTAGTAGVEAVDAEAPVKIFADGDVIRVVQLTDEASRVVEVYDAYGRLVRKGYAVDGDINGLPTGRIYIVRCDNVVTKVLLRN